MATRTVVTTVKTTAQNLPDLLADWEMLGSRNNEFWAGAWQLAKDENLLTLTATLTQQKDDI